MVIQYISKTKRYFDVKVTFHFHDTKKLFFFSLTNFKSGMSSLQKKNIKNLKKKPTCLRLVFTSDGVGVVIRRAERYDLVKIKPTESDSTYVSVAYNQVKTAMSESQAEAEE